LETGEALFEKTLSPITDDLSRPFAVAHQFVFFRVPRQATQKKSMPIPTAPGAAVTWRVRGFTCKSQFVHPFLPNHLDCAIHTGLFCDYEPENNPHWKL
jgi:hypothetical protein